MPTSVDPIIRARQLLRFLNSPPQYPPEAADTAQQARALFEQETTRGLERLGALAAQETKLSAAEAAAAVQEKFFDTRSAKQLLSYINKNIFRWLDDYVPLGSVEDKDRDDASRHAEQEKEGESNKQHLLPNKELSQSQPSQSEDGSGSDSGSGSSPSSEMSNTVSHDSDHIDSNQTSKGQVANTRANDAQTNNTQANTQASSDHVNNSSPVPQETQGAEKSTAMVDNTTTPSSQETHPDTASDGEPSSVTPSSSQSQPQPLTVLAPVSRSIVAAFAAATAAAPSVIPHPPSPTRSRNNSFASHNSHEQEHTHGLSGTLATNCPQILCSLQDDTTEAFRFVRIEHSWARRYKVLSWSDFKPAANRLQAVRYVNWLESIRFNTPDHTDFNPVPSWVRDSETARARRLGIDSTPYETRWIRGGVEGLPGGGYGAWRKDSRGRWVRVLAGGRCVAPPNAGVFAR